MTDSSKNCNAFSFLCSTSAASGRGPWTELTVSLLMTGLFPCSGLDCLPAQEEGPGLDWPVALLRKRVPD